MTNQNSFAVQLKLDALKKLIAQGLDIPKKNGPIKWEGKVVGYADSFNGIQIRDLEFRKNHVKDLDIMWYVN